MEQSKRGLLAPAFFARADLPRWLTVGTVCLPPFRRERMPIRWPVRPCENKAVYVQCNRLGSARLERVGAFLFLALIPHCKSSPIVGIAQQPM